MAATFENLFDDLLTFSKPSVNFSKVDTGDVGDTDVGEKAGSNTNTGTTTGSRSQDSGTTDTKEGKERVEEYGSKYENGEKAETHAEKSSGDVKEIEEKEAPTVEVESTGVDIAPTVDLSFLDNADDLFGEEAKSVESKEESKKEDITDINVLQSDEKKKKDGTFSETDLISTKPSEIVDEALKNATLGNSLANIGKKIPNPNPVNTNNIVGNIEGLEAQGENKYSELLNKSGTSITEATQISNNIEEYKKAMAEARKTVLDNMAKNDPEYLEEVKNIIRDKATKENPNITPEQLEERTNELLDGIAHNRLMADNGAYSDADDYITKGIKELSRLNKQASSTINEGKDVYESLPTSIINNEKQGLVGRMIDVAGSRKSDNPSKKFEIYTSENPIFAENALDNQMSAIAPADNEAVLTAIQNALREPIEQLDSSITPKVQEAVTEAVNSEQSKTYFQKLMENGQPFVFDDWAKESGFVGNLGQAAAAIGGGAIAGTVGYDAVKKAVEAIANKSLYSKTNIPRTDKQFRQYHEEAVKDIEDTLSAAETDEQKKDAADTYRFQKDRFVEQYNKLKQEYEDFYSKYETNSVGKKVVPENEIAEAEKLNKKMETMNKIAESYNVLGDKLSGAGVEYSEGKPGEANIEQEADYSAIDKWANDLQPKAKVSTPSWMADSFFDDGFTTESGTDFKELDARQIEMIDNMLDYDNPTLPNGKLFSAEIAMDLRMALNDEYNDGKVSFSGNTSRNNLSQALADKNEKVISILQQAIDDSEGRYSATGGTGRAAIIKSAYDNAAKDVGYVQANFVADTVPQLSKINYFDDFDINATMNTDASPEAMAEKYGESWTNADDYHKLVGQLVEKLVPTENDPQNFEPLKEQMERVLDNNDNYAEVITKYYFPEMFNELNEQNGQPTGNFMLEYMGTVLKNLDEQEIYQIAQIAKANTKEADEKPTETKTESAFDKIETTPINEIADTKEKPEPKTDVEESTSENVSADSEEVAQRELTEEELAKIFGISYDESAKPKSDYNYGLMNEEAYSDEDVKVFVSNNRNDPIFRAFVRAVREYK